MVFRLSVRIPEYHGHLLNFGLELRSLARIKSIVFSQRTAQELGGQE
jgi:hypothetical protein